MHPASASDLRLLTRLRQIEDLALLASAVVCASSLAIWLLPGQPAPLVDWLGKLRPPTAAAFLFADLSLYLSARGRRETAAVLATGIAFGLIMVSSLALLGKLTAGMHPHMPLVPPATSAAMSLLAYLAVLWSRQSSGLRSLVADLGTAVALAAVLFLLSGTLFGSTTVAGAGGISLQSPATVLAASLLVVVLVARRVAADGLLGFLRARGIGSHIARTVLPAALVVPFVLFEAIETAKRAGIASIELSHAVLARLLALAGAVVILWIGHHTNWMEGQLRRQSATDQLTGLLNRRGFEDATARLARIAAHDHPGMVAFFFDLDNLKQANDLLGHTAGSEVIQRFADLLTLTFRKTDIIGRVGGDEFVVLAPAPVEAAADLLDRFARVVEAVNHSDFLPVPLSFSVGYAELFPGEAGDIESLIAEADARMYGEKSRKRAA